MRIAIEETGNFGFPEDGGFEPYLLVAVIAPESEAARIGAVADAIGKRSRGQEIKANKLGTRRLAKAAPAVGRLPIAAVVYALDSHMMDRSFIAAFRMQQAIRIARMRDEMLERHPDAKPKVLAEI